MTAVTVCVPAYRAAPFITDTLRSVQRQCYSDLRVEIAIDPSKVEPLNDVLGAVQPFLSDGRFRVRENPARLGWDGNIRAMLQRIETPYFVILPHDDILHSTYVETLLAALDKRPDAAVAYGDMSFFGHTEPSRKWVDLPAEGTRDEQLLAFFLAGAEAVPWRGVTRRAVIGAVGGFPTDAYQGFAVECEWALALLLHGPAVRVPRPLYFKRLHPPRVTTASRSRVSDISREELYRAWRGHRSRMIAALDRSRGRVETATDVVRLAAHSAMLRRHHHSLGPVLPADEAAQASRMLEHADVLSADIPGARRVAAMLHLVLSHHELGSGRPSSGQRHAEAAAASDPGNAEALIHLGCLNLQQGHVLKAFDLVNRADAVARGASGIEALRTRVLAVLSGNTGSKPRDGGRRVSTVAWHQTD